MKKEITLKSIDNHTLILKIEVNVNNTIESEVKKWFDKNLDYFQFNYIITDSKNI